MIQSVEQFYARKQLYRRVWMGVWAICAGVNMPFVQYNVFNLAGLLWAIAAFSWLLSRYVLTAEFLTDLGKGSVKLKTVSKDDV